MQFRESVREIGRRCSERWGSDIERAAREALQAIRRLPEYPEIVEELVAGMSRELVYSCRTDANVEIKRQACSGDPKVVVGSSRVVARVNVTIYDYHVAGTVLGAVLGKDLREIADRESMLSEGHSFRARLCLRLAEIVPADKTVREAVSERRLRSVFKEVRGRKTRAKVA